MGWAYTCANNSAGSLVRLAAHGLAHLPRSLLGGRADLGHGGVVEQAAAAQVGLQPPERIAGQPPLDLRGGPVARRVIGVGVRLDPVGDGLDERRAAPGRGPAKRGANRGEDRGGVVPVDEHRAHAVADAPVRERRRRGLLGQRHADRVAVVLHQEDDRGLPYPGEVQRLVHVALAGRPVAGQHERRLVAA